MGHHNHQEGKIHKDQGHQHKDEHEHHDHSNMIEDYKRRFWISLGLTIPILLLSPMIQKFLGLDDTLSFAGSQFVLFAISTVVFFYGGYPFLKGLFDEMKKLQPGMMTLIAIAISVAYFYSSAVVFGLGGKMFFWELVTLIDIMLLGHWIEMKSVMGASKALEELAKLMPSDAHKIMDGGNIIDVPLEELKTNDRILVKPGEKVPADGVVVDGQSSVNEAMLTGESKPVMKKAKDKVIGGAVNGEGSLEVIVEKTGKDSFLSQVIDLVKEAQESKSKTQNLANRAAFWLTIIALAGGTITLAYWITIGDQDFAFALERMVTVMVITCPHALGLAVPLVVAVSTAIAASSGLLIRDRTAFESARNIDAIIFDKTGTLTKGEFGITDIISFDNSLSDDEIVKYAASVEMHSEHPIAQGIVKSSDDSYDVKDFRAIPGKGAVGKVNNQTVAVVSPGYLRDEKINIPDNQIEILHEQGKTVIFLLIDNKLKGAIALADIIREESKEAIAKFKDLGIKTIMLTGDNEKVAKWVSDELNLDE